MPFPPPFLICACDLKKKRSIREKERKRELRGNLRHFVSRVAPILSKFHARPRSVGRVSADSAEISWHKIGRGGWTRVETKRGGKARVDETRVCNFDG